MTATEGTTPPRPAILLTIPAIILAFAAGWAARSTTAPPQPSVSLAIARAPPPPPPPFQIITAPARLAAEGGARVTATLPAWVFAQPAAFDAAPGSRAPPSGALKALATAQDYEDVIAHNLFFAGVRGGLILETGALDGRQFSVSNFFVFGLGWRAVHVEGAPDSFARLAANRPESLNIHTALCSRAEPLHYVNGGPVGGFWEFMSDNLKNAYHPKVNAAALPLVTCRPLSPLLEMFGIAHVDLWILDVEGAELEVLQTFDFTRVSVNVVCAELDEGNPAKDNAVRALLLAAGFVFDHRSVRNDWFVRDGFCGTPEAPPAPPAADRTPYYKKKCAARARGL